MVKLPIGIQSFEDLRRNGYVYIDKTMYINQLVNSGKVYFLSRPRRFGKSLFLTTLEAYFLGQKDLFQGLKIEETESAKPLKEQWVSYPVIKFSLAGGEFQSQDGLANRLRYILDAFEKSYGIEHLENLDLPTQFQNCIEEAYRITGRQVVVLVDEYDKPLLETMNVDEAQEQRNRILFKSFFSALKDEDSYLRFVFVTGVTKFSKVSIFSDLNQLEDISLTKQYSTICGITESEMKDYLGEEITAMAADNGISTVECLSKLARKYDGYHFAADADGVYNPFSLFTALKQKSFGNYWFSTGTPTFLVRKLAQSGFRLQDFTDGIHATADRMSEYRADDDDVVPLFYQSGYLTISGFDPVFQEYTLSYPNDEVKYGYLNSLIPMVGPEYVAKTGTFSASKMIQYLNDCEVDSLMTMLQALLASIPYYEGKAPENEQQWRNVLYAVFTVLGQYVRTEVHSAGGRSDFIVENEKYIYIFEFKQNQTAAEALKQINARGYALPYAASGKEIVKVGAVFSAKRKTLDAWEVERGEIA